MLNLSRFFAKNQSASFLKGAEAIVAETNIFTKECIELSDEAVRARFNDVRKRARDAGVTAEQDIPIVFALVREAARRTLKQPHFDVQIAGGLALLRGKIAEMRTGEGKTLVATLAASPRYVNQASHSRRVFDGHDRRVFHFAVRVRRG